MVVGDELALQCAAVLQPVGGDEIGLAIVGRGADRVLELERQLHYCSCVGMDQYGEMLFASGF